MQYILSFSGSSAMYIFPNWVWNIILVLWLIGALGMLLHRKAGRLIFLIVSICLIPINILNGVNVTLAPEALLSHISTSLEAVTLSMAYFSPLKDKFW